MENALLRVWTNFISRLDGPMHLRFILQPAVAIYLAVRAGVRDAREGTPPFLPSLRDRELRRERLRHAWSDVGRVFVLAVVLDTFYQLRVHQSVYALELLLTAAFLALLPYALVRGPASRVARAWLGAKTRNGRVRRQRS
jgi:hypothetical protein